MAITTEVQTLIEPLKTIDPRIYQALQLLNKELGRLTAAVDPLVQQSTLTGGGTATISSPSSFTAISTGLTIRFNWTSVSGAAQYEVRKGSDWDTASFVFRSPSLQADIDPVLYGTHTYLIKSLDSGSNYSATPEQVVFTVTQIPAVTISPQVIDNNILLYWADPVSTFNIDYYDVLKDGTSQGHVRGTFTSFFEAVAASYEYEIVAYDIAGNVSLVASVTVGVNSPPDYGLQDTRVSDLLGTKTNVVLESGPKLLCCWTATSFQVHFTGHAWLTPKNQVDAGFPIYIQPANLTGSYEETFDYGAVLNNIIAVVTFNINVVTPLSDVSVVVKMSVSDDNITYTAFASGSSQFYSNFRYLKLKIEFTGADTKALIEFYNLTISLNVKRENDGGEVSALSTDATGTEVFFNKAFKDVESITATVKSTTEPFTVIIKFTDIPNPTSFFVFAFDTTGNRVSKSVEWKARGIV